MLSVVRQSLSELNLARRQPLAVHPRRHVHLLRRPARGAPLAGSPGDERLRAAPQPHVPAAGEAGGRVPPGAPPAGEGGGRGNAGEEAGGGAGGADGVHGREKWRSRLGFGIFGDGGGWYLEKEQIIIIYYLLFNFIFLAWGVGQGQAGCDKLYF